MECYYSCQGKYVCIPLPLPSLAKQNQKAKAIESFSLEDSHVSNYECVISIYYQRDQYAIKVPIGVPYQKSIQHYEGQGQGSYVIFQLSASQIPYKLQAPAIITIKIQDLTQYSAGNISHFLAIDHLYYNGSSESGGNDTYDYDNNIQVPLIFNNAGENSIDQRQYTYSYTPIGIIQTLYFVFNPNIRAKV